MDCGTGAALGQQFAKDAYHMHAVAGARPTGNPEQDALMGEVLMAQAPTGEWAQNFAALQHQHHHHHHSHHTAMRRQQNDTFMVQQQQEMEEAFRSSSAMQHRSQQHHHHHHHQLQHQQALFGAAMMGTQMMGPMMYGGNMGGGCLMGAPPMMPYAPLRVGGEATATTPVGPTSQQQQQQQQESQQQQQHQNDSGWADQLRDAQWAQDYKDAKVFTLEGQTEQTLEEHAKSSKFFQFMDKIRNKELLIDEETGQVVEGPGPDPEVTEDTEYLKDWAAAEGLNLPPGVFEHMLRNPQGVDSLQQGGLVGDSDTAVMDDGGLDLTADVEDWAKEYAEMQDRIHRAQNETDYPFEPNNPYMYHDKPMEEGLEMLQLANLAEAALAFEAVCQKNPENVESWRLLGTTQAENEKDGLAIIALNNARLLDPMNSAIHAALAVSHTNEHNVQAALQSLRSWLLSQPEYEHLGSVNLQEMEGPDAMDITDENYFFAAPNEYRECSILLRAAVEMCPNDPQLHASIGVLNNLSQRFDEAAENFRRAVELRPDDPHMWNKLGATLANGNRPQEALEAYNRALDINPGYVRVMYNMAVSYSNMSQYPLAAKQITRAIAFQERGTNPQGEFSRLATRGLWDLLRMTLNLMERNDLVEASWEQNLTPFLKEFGLEDVVL